MGKISPMQIPEFYPNPVTTCVILRWEGHIRKVVNFYGIELTDIHTGRTLPVIFFQ
jgi:hypothetical protein